MYYIGIDGGGTTSDFVLLDEAGKILRQFQSGPTNIHSHGLEKVYSHLKIGMKEILKNLEVSKDQVMVTLASAGVDQQEDIKPYIDMFLKLNFNNVLVVNDGIGALSAGTQGQDGILVIAGTGSIVFGKRGNLIKRIGGWGHILGDEGSAYKIAIEGIKSVLHDFEGYGKETSLSQAIASEIGIKNIDEYIRFIYQNNNTKDQIANLSKVVDDQSCQGDVVAIDIIKKEAKQLSLQVVAMYKSLFEGEVGVNLIMNGSVIKKSKVFYETFKDVLETFDFEFKFLETSAAIGAAYLGKKQVEDEKSIC